MLQNVRRRVASRLAGEESGFTLIELLVVMLILGILAAIALPAFFNQKDKANDSKAKENAHTAQVAVETCSTDNQGSYATCNTSSVANREALEDIEPTFNEDIDVETTDTGEPTEGYVVASESDNGNSFVITRTGTGGLTYTCTTGGNGGCPAAETWGE